MTNHQRNRSTYLIFGALALACAFVLAFCNARAEAAEPGKRATGDFMLWRWVDCAPGAEHVAAEIINLDSVGYRYQIKTWVWEEGELDRTVTQRPWVLPATFEPGVGYHGEITTTPLDNDDTTVRSRITRVHQVSGEWVQDQLLMDTTTEGCDRLHPVKLERRIKISSGPR